MFVRFVLNVFMHNDGDFVKVILLYDDCGLFGLPKVRYYWVQLYLNKNVSGFGQLIRFILKPEQTVSARKSTPKFD